MTWSSSPGVARHVRRGGLLVIANTVSYEGGDLHFIGETRFRLRVYTLKELVELAGRAGWRFEAAYSDPEKGAGYLPCRSGFNVVFSRTL